nr:Retrovirus-related Pol polyprotein from transposon RE1 [Ipomoea batatas]
MAATYATPINPLPNAGDAANNEPTLLPNPIYPVPNVEVNLSQLLLSLCKIVNSPIWLIPLGYARISSFFGDIASTLSSAIEILISSGRTSREAWNILANTYARPTRGKPMEHEDITDKILDSLDSNYQSIIDVVNGHDSIISFEELHEKLINKELALHRAVPPTTFPATAHPTQTRPASTFQTRQPSYPRFINNSSRPAPKPFLGHC